MDQQPPSSRKPASLATIAWKLAKQGHNAWRDAETDKALPTRTEVKPYATVEFDQLAMSQQQHLAYVVDHALRQVGHLSRPREMDSTTDLSGNGSPVGWDQKRVLQFLSQPEPIELGQLLTFWRNRDAAVWSTNGALFCRLAERLLEVNEPLVAYDVATEGLTLWPQDVRLVQLQGMSLSRCGDSEKANAIFCQLRVSGHTDEETLGNLARTYKDLWLACCEPARKQSFRDEAFRAYLEAYETQGGYWSGVNAATLALIRGDANRAAQLSAEVKNKCLQSLSANPDKERYWLLATLGETSLILGEQDEAASWYRQAIELAGNRYGNISTTRQQARLIVQHKHLDWQPLESCFRLPRVVVFTGHMIDCPERAFPRFPEELAEAVQSAIQERISSWGPIQGYASAACGSDLLFLETLLDLGQEAFVVLPCPPEQFLSGSVEFSSSNRWRERFESVLRRANGVSVLSPAGSQLTDAAYDYTNRVLSGLAKMQAARLHLPLSLLAVWDGDEECPLGGTGSLVSRWRQLLRPVEWIDLKELFRSKFAEQPTRKTSESEPKQAPEDVGSQIMAMMFADAKGYSQLSESEILRFGEEFLGAIATLTNSSPCQPTTKNTWGDGLFYSFASVRGAGQFAMDLVDLVNNTDWSKCDLPADLSIRIALHAGPVFPCVDLVTGNRTFSGAHVSRTARIEPITPPGQVYASQAFAALASEDPECEFQCHYVGLTPLAKGYGAMPTYHVSRPG